MVVSNPHKKLQFKIMKKSSKFASAVLAISFFGTATPVNTNSTFPEKGPFEKTSLESKINGQPDTGRVYSYGEISKMVHDIYRFAPHKPDYLNEEFLREIIQAESGYDTRAESKKGARGLMQLMPATWKDIEKKRSYDEYVFDPRTNLKVGIKYLLLINKQFEKDYDGWENLNQEEKRARVLSAYNAGISRFKKEDWQLENMPKETRKYVGNIIGRMN